jgi:hypothetical protein
MVCGVLSHFPSCKAKKDVAPDRRIAIEDTAMRHGRKSSAKTFNGFTEHVAVDVAKYLDINSGIF